VIWFSLWLALTVPTLIAHAWLERRARHAEAVTAITLARIEHLLEELVKRSPAARKIVVDELQKATH
jgi:hypothetical protein